MIRRGFEAAEDALRLIRLREARGGSGTLEDADKAVAL